MPIFPDFTDPRYLDEVGWFLSREKYEYELTDRSYAADRMLWSGMFLDDFLTASQLSEDWIRSRSVVSIGSGCSGDMAAWPAASKISVDPLSYAYQKLEMLIAERPGANPTVYLATGIEALMLLDNCADVVLCRNALDHMHDPRFGLDEMWRILKPDGRLFLWVDIGGGATPDEPSPLEQPDLLALLTEKFHVEWLEDHHKAHSKARNHSVRILARSKPGPRVTLDKDAILRAYERTFDNL